MELAIVGTEPFAQEPHAAHFDIFRSMIFWCLFQGARLVASLAHLPLTVRFVIGQLVDIISTLSTILAI